MSDDKRRSAGARPIDHVVLPVARLGAARQRFEVLGFTVAADALHPFGTANCCVYLADGTFLEPLAVADAPLCEKEARKGNVFTARDRAYRFRNGEDGFSALVFATDNAVADHKAFRRAGVSAGPKLAFSRPFRSASGEEDEASFLLAFAADLRAPDAFFFTCERVRVPAVDRSPLQVHANGATGLSAVILSEERPSDFRSFMQALTRQAEPAEISGSLSFAANVSRIDVLSPEVLRREFGVERSDDSRGLRLEGLVFDVVSLGALAGQFEERPIDYRVIDDRLVVDRAAGQGAFFAFRERAGQ